MQVIYLISYLKDLQLILNYFGIFSVASITVSTGLATPFKYIFQKILQLAIIKIALWGSDFYTLWGSKSSIFTI